ncbi:MAG: NAD(P)(+) transhydrogenase (Re/Si-specific) subunit beta [Eubacteriales bacterium]|nr:NAD(P)(+) transhydrogenase (Re/Si-specific) subunit beta [Eubacteriales bacterium]
MFSNLFSLPLFLEAETIVRSAGTTTFYRIASVVLIILVLVGLNRMSSVEKSLSGNRLGAISMFLAVVLTLWYYNIFNIWQIWAALVVGALIGSYLYRKVDMIQMPQMVGLLNGFGGLASMLAGILTLAGSDINPAGTVTDPTFSGITAGLAIVVGGLTWTGSAIAAAKLHRIMDQKPKVLPGHQFWTSLTLLISLVSAILFAFPPFNEAGSARTLLIIIAVIAGNAFGYFLAIRVGGADMPITISLLNSFSGVAGAIAGMAISDVLLVAIGGIVGASGLILTQIMCRSMNRKLGDILLGKTASKPKAPAAKAEKAPAPAEPAAKAAPVGKTAAPAKSEELSPSEAAAAKLQDAESVIIVPGYGMALSQAQPLVKQLTQALEDSGKKVSFAIHPVAGRMPGHMNVLLAEVDIPYDQLYEMDAINDEFANTDCVIVIGANDVLNPAANTAEGTPIYGMPVLDVAAAKHIIICNFDLKPGYAGVPNPLYEEAETNHEHVQLYLGDAKETLLAILKAFRESKKAKKDAAADTGESKAEAAAVEEAKGPSTAAKLLRQAKNVIIVPGYGMALSQAQPLVKQLMDQLETEGADVEFAIHPVAGRMPGHMNVLLAEVDIPYDKLHEMSDINDKFKDSDVVLVIGANDVINPAANTAEGTPIYGMPVLQVADAPHVIICNFDLKPGYAGVENPLYEEAGKADDRVILLLGDAKETLKSVMEEL